MASFNKRHTLTKVQLQEKSARRGRRSGGTRQSKGTPPSEHRLPGVAGWKVPSRSPSPSIILKDTMKVIVGSEKERKNAQQSE